MRRMRYAALRSEDGAYLGVTEDGRLRTGRTALSPAEVFEWNDAGAGAVVLRSVVIDQTITAQGSEQELFLCTDDGGDPIRCQVSDLDALMAQALSQRCCCGLGEHHGAPGELHVQWNRETHRQIVDNAFFLVGRHPALEGAATLGTLWANALFRDELHRGLVDADRVGKPEYTGFLYAKHFYDPDTGTNYLGFRSGTALTEGLRHFDLSLKRLAEALPVIGDQSGLPERMAREMGYSLGLALHYFTDLTQPMHAANFANVFASGLLHDWRHTGFEYYAEANRSRFVGDLTAVRPEEIDPRALGFGTPADVLQAVALQAKRIFTERVGPLAAKKIYWHQWYDGVPMIVSTWGAEADPALAEALPYGQKLTAAFLLYWATFVVTAPQSA